MSKQIDRKIFLAGMVFLAALVLAGCSSPSVQVSMAVPLESKSPRPETTIQIHNCNTKEPMRRSLAEEAEVMRSITISDTASAVQTGESLVLSSEQKSRLIQAIEQAYQQLFEAAQQKVSETVLVIPGDRVHYLQIYWNQQEYNAEISFSEAGQQYAAAYTCILETPNSRLNAELICTG